MIKFLGQMLKFPVAAFVTSMEIITKVLHDFQRTFEQSVEDVTNRAAEALSQPTTSMSATENCSVKESANSEDVHMPDQDLSGDDLKVVRYKIIYTERGNEQFLYSADGLVNYNTTAADWGGLRVAEWMNDPVNQATIHRLGLGHPNRRRFITTFVEVLQRFPKQEKEYDRRQVEVLEEIRNRI